MGQSSIGAGVLGKLLPDALIKRFVSGKVESTVAKGAFGAFAVNVAGTGVAFFLQIFLARLMGAEQYGIYVYAITWLGLLSLVAKLGYDTALLRYVAAYKSQKEWSLTNGIMRVSDRVVLAASFLTSLVTAAVVWQYQARIGEQLAQTMYITCAAVPFGTLGALRGASLRALRRVVLSRLPEEVFRPVVMFALAGLATLLFSNAATAPFVMLLQLLSIAGSLFLAEYWVSTKMPPSVAESTPTYRHKEWFYFALPLLLYSGMHTILSRMDTVIIGYYLDTTQAGVYAVASRIAKLMVFGLSAVNFISAPMISSFYAQNRMEDLQRMLTFSARMLFVFCVPVFTIIVLFGDKLLMLFGERFAEGYISLIILTAGQAINALTGSVGLVMTMTGHQNVALKMMIATAVVNVLLNIALIPHWGIDGAAFATSITVAGWSIGSVLYVHRRIGLRSTIF